MFATQLQCRGVGGRSIETTNVGHPTTRSGRGRKRANPVAKAGSLSPLKVKTDGQPAGGRRVGGINTADYDRPKPLIFFGSCAEYMDPLDVFRADLDAFMQEQRRHHTKASSSTKARSTRY
jgi:hypothetical protein